MRACVRTAHASPNGSGCDIGDDVEAAVLIAAADRAIGNPLCRLGSSLVSDTPCSLTSHRSIVELKTNYC